MADSSGFGLGSLAFVGVGFGLLGFLGGSRRGKRVTHETWLTALEQTTESGTCAGSDLNEQDRLHLMRALTKRAERAGITGKLTDKIAAGGRDLLAGAGILSLLKGKDPDDTLVLGDGALQTLIEEGRELAAAEEAGD